MGGRGGDRSVGHSGAYVVTPPETQPPVPQSMLVYPLFSTTFSRTEMETIQRLMAQLDSSSRATSTSSVVFAGTPASAFSASESIPGHPWIIDSGASHHMTGMSSLFSTYRVCSSRDKVRIVDGSLSSVVGTGDISHTSSMSLSSIFHVPNFKYNLVSLSHLTKSMNCSITFFSFSLCLSRPSDKADDW